MKIKRLGLREEDLEEKFVRSSGKGGQHLNKASTCVYLRHKPTGIEVKCQQERSQSINRILARLWLLDKLEAIALRKQQQEKAAIEKARRQRRKRSVALKEKILRDKKRLSEKKQMRAFRPEADS
jgi:protein subunit release factor B